MKKKTDTMQSYNKIMRDVAKNDEAILALLDEMDDDEDEDDDEDDDEDEDDYNTNYIPPVTTVKKPVESHKSVSTTDAVLYSLLYLISIYCNLSFIFKILIYQQFSLVRLIIGMGCIGLVFLVKKL